MTLSDMADFVCNKVNQTDAEDVASAKGFLARRYEMVWNDQLWRDAVASVELTYDWDTTEAATGLHLMNGEYVPNNEGIVLMPAMCAMVLAVRTTERFIQVEQHETNFRMDFDAFKESGAVAGFINLESIVAYVASLNGATPVNTVLVSNSDSDYTAALSATVEYGMESNFSRARRARRIGKVGALTDAFQADVIYSLGKPVTVGTVGVTNTVDAPVTSTWYPTMTATDTIAPRKCRFKLTPKPDQGTTLRVLFKLRHTPLEDDNQSPGITGIDNTLLALAQGDMLQRERQYQKAELCYAQGAAMLDQLKKIEVIQQAYEKRIMPFDGYGNPMDLYTHPPLSY